MMDSLFDYDNGRPVSYAPLADRMRPERLEDILGQEGAVGRNSFLYRMIEKDTIPSILLFGPPGCGKTTIASVIAKMTHSHFVKLNATASGTKEIDLNGAYVSAGLIDTHLHIESTMLSPAIVCADAVPTILCLIHAISQALSDLSRQCLIILI